MSRLLINESPLQVLPSLAIKIGLNEAIVLQQVHYWLNPNHNKNFIDGRYWVYNSCEGWHSQFPFWSKDTLKRAFTSLLKQGLLIDANYNKDKFNHSKWYSIEYGKLQGLEECTDRLVQIAPIDNSKMPHSNNANCTNGKMQDAPIDQCSLHQSYIEQKITNIDYTETSSSSACAHKDEEDDEADINIPQEMLRIWNELVQKDAHPASLTEQRAISLQACLKHYFQNSLEQFESYCQKISQTPFLMGQGANGWKATLDWALDPTHITKVLEGHYFHPKPSSELFRAPSQSQQSYSQPSSITVEELNRYGSTWAKVCEKLISELGASTFTSWFRDLVPEQIESANPVLKAPTAFAKDWIKSHHRQAIEQAIQSFNPQFQSLTFSLSDRAGDEE